MKQLFAVSFCFVCLCSRFALPKRSHHRVFVSDKTWKKALPHWSRRSRGRLTRRRWSAVETHARRTRRHKQIRGAFTNICERIALDKVLSHSFHSDQAATIFDSEQKLQKKEKGKEAINGKTLAADLASSFRSWRLLNPSSEYATTSTLLRYCVACYLSLSVRKSSDLWPRPTKFRFGFIYGLFLHVYYVFKNLQTDAILSVVSEKCGSHRRGGPPEIQQLQTVCDWSMCLSREIDYKESHKSGRDEIMYSADIKTHKQTRTHTYMARTHY